MSNTVSPPLVSIWSITYNHALFIRQCLDGFVMQNTNFPYEVVIHDDASTDGTDEILKEYAAKYPQIIKPLYETENQYSQGKDFGSPILNSIKSKYVAICEGDDYWIDPCKLQKQVDFLEAHPECSICFHPVNVVFEAGEEPTKVFPAPETRFNKTLLTLQDLLKVNFIQTNSVMYRWRFSNEDIANVFPRDILPGDWYLHLLHAQKGDIGFIDDVMAVYRRHSGGIWFVSSKGADALHAKYGIQEIAFFDNVCKGIAPNANDYINNKLLPMFGDITNAYIKKAHKEEIVLISRRYPEYFIEQFIHHQNQINEQVRNIAEQTEQIAGLNRNIANLNQTVDNQDEQIKEQEHQIDVLLHSVSYRVSQKLMRNKIFKMVYRIVKKCYHIIHGKRIPHRI